MLSRKLESLLPCQNHYYSLLCVYMILTISISTFSDRERKEILLLKISELLLMDKDDTKLCEWLAFFLGKVQANFTADAKNENLEHSLFCLDLFIYCLVFTSGCSIFLSGEHSLENRAKWLNKLPDALWMLTKRKYWNEHMPRVCKFWILIPSTQFWSFLFCISFFCISDFRVSLPFEPVHEFAKGIHKNCMSVISLREKS